MSQTPKYKADLSDSDEISIKDILLKLWHSRGIILILPLLCGGLAVIAILTMTTRMETSVVHYVNLIGVEKSQYPNGTTFSVQDLVAPEVIEALATHFDIADKTHVKDAISVNLSSPSADGIIKKYQLQLSKIDLNLQQINDINRQFEEELASSIARTVRIDVRYDDLFIPREVAIQLALALPDVWAKIFTKRYRILDTVELQKYAQVSITDLRTSLGALESSRAIRAILKGTAVISADSRLRMLQTDDLVTAADLNSLAGDFDKIYMSAILNHNLRKNDTLTQLYVQDVQLEIEKVEEQIRGLQQTITDITDIMANQRSSTNSNTELGLSRADSIEVSGNALEAIVSLTKRASLSDYLTDLFDKQNDLIAERAMLRVELRKVDEASEFPAEFLDGAQRRYDNIITQYNALLGKARDLNSRNNATLHTPVGAPSITQSYFPPRMALIVILGLVVGGFIAVIFALLRPEPARPPEARR